MERTWRVQFSIEQQQVKFGVLFKYLSNCQALYLGTVTKKNKIYFRTLDFTANLRRGYKLDTNGLQQ